MSMPTTNLECQQIVDQDRLIDSIREDMKMSQRDYRRVEADRAIKLIEDNASVIADMFARHYYDEAEMGRDLKELCSECVEDSIG